MFAKRPICSLVIPLVFGFLFLLPAHLQAQRNQVLGELRFSGATDVERNSGVWIDGLYVGYLNELKDDKKIMLLAGEHEVSIRQAGYKDFTTIVIIEPGLRHLLRVAMERNPLAEYPGSDPAVLKLDIKPKRAAVFLDDGYVGHASDFGGAFRSMALTPGKHRIKVELPGYRTFETEVNLLPGQESEIKTELLEGSIKQASELVRAQ